MLFFPSVSSMATSIPSQEVPLMNPIAMVPMPVSYSIPTSAEGTFCKQEKSLAIDFVRAGSPPLGRFAAEAAEAGVESGVGAIDEVLAILIRKAGTCYLSGLHSIFGRRCRSR